MNSFWKKSAQRAASLFCCLLLGLGSAFSLLPPAAASGASQDSLSVSENADSVFSAEDAEEIRITVSVFENAGRGWLLNPMQLSIPAGSGLQDLMELLEQYAYIDGAVVTNGELVSLTDDYGRQYAANREEEAEWLLILNGIECATLDDSIDEDGNPVYFSFTDGDSLQLVYTSSPDSDADTSAVSVPSRSLSVATADIPWDIAYDDALSSSANWLKSNSTNPFALTVFGAAGYSVDYKYLTGVLRGISEQETAANGQTLAENILCVSFSGISAENFSDRNLLEELISFPDLSRLDTVLGLMAYDCNGYIVPADALNSRDAMINVIMAGQNGDGGIASVQGEESSVYLTALSLAALAPYRDDETIGPCIERALEWLSSVQQENGSFYEVARPSCRATSAVILALSSLSISLSDSRFLPSEQNLMDALMNFYADGSGFFERSGQDPSEASTELAILAIVSQKTDRNPLILRSPVTGSGSISFTSSEEVSQEPSSQPVLDEETRTRFHFGLLGAICGVSVGIILMLGVLIHLKNKYKHDR